MTISVRQERGMLVARAPFYPPFAERARALMGRCQQGTWCFALSREAQVRHALWECYGTDGTLTPTVNVEVRLTAPETDEASVFALGRLLVRRGRSEWPVYLDCGVTIQNGGFPAKSGTKDRPTLGHRKAVLLVRDVPQALAEAAAAKEPDRYHVFQTTEGRTCR